MTHTKTQTTLVPGGTGKTGRRVRRALGRESRDFTGYARHTAASGVWDIPDASRADR